MSDSKRPKFDDIRGSVEIRTGGKLLRIPDRRDYAQHLLDQGLIEGENDLADQPDLVVGAQLHWHLKGQTGCKFAQRLSADPSRYGWRIEVAGSPAPFDAAALAAWAREVVAAAIAAPNVEAVSLLFPQLTEPMELVALVGDLGRLPGWSIEEEIGDAAEGGESLVNIALRVLLNDVEVRSWILGFGPFPFLPITRRAPFAELAIRTKAKPSGPLYPRLKDDRSAAHLADMIHTAISPAGRDSMWELTEKRRIAILDGEDDPAAKAKVTFSIPRELWLMRPSVEPRAATEQDLAQAG